MTEQQGIKTTGMWIWKEKIAGKGEDSKPLYFSDENSGLLVLGVFDGLGGSGSKPFTKGDETHSGAYWASRIVYDCVQEFLKKNEIKVKGENQFHALKRYIKKSLSWLKGAKYKLSRVKKNEIEVKLKKKVDALGQHIKKSLCDWLKDTKYEPSRVKSSLIKLLPTTAAIIDCFNYKSSTDQARNGCYALFIWAGDSRGYIFDHQDGLMQVTQDDSYFDNDALASLRNDPPMTNYINASTDFFLHSCVIRVKPDQLLLTATDGCFGYLKSPMHFEHVLLETMQKADSWESWKSHLIQELAAVAADDISLSMMRVDKEKSFKALNDSFKKRFELVTENYIRDGEENIDSLWNEYKKTYNRYLDNPPENPFISVQDKPQQEGDIANGK
jgi:serine/threonine protein phosphatase PrpC